jgi:hypothetical protein
VVADYPLADDVARWTRALWQRPSVQGLVTTPRPPAKPAG